MFDKLISKSEAWMVRWADLVFKPRSSGRAAAIKPIEFFLGNHLLSYVLCIGVCFGFFATYYRPALHVNLRERALDIVGALTAIFPAYGIINFFIIFLGASMSYLIYNMLGSKAAAKDHFNLNVELSFLEPIAAASLALWILMIDSGRALAIVHALFAVFVLTRLWYLVVSYFQLRELHEMPSRRKALQAFAFGQVGAFVVSGFLTYFILLMLVIIVIGVGD